MLGFSGSWVELGVTQFWRRTGPILIWAMVYLPVTQPNWKSGSVMAIMVDDEAIDKVQSQFPLMRYAIHNILQSTISCLLLTLNEGPN
jgi:hypothetical protein